MGKVYIPDRFQRHDQADQSIIQTTAGDAFRAHLNTVPLDAPVEPKVEAGLCTTGRSLDKTKLDDEVMSGAIAKEMEAYPIAKEMEAHAIAWVCDLFSQKFFMIKAVTDLVEDPTTGSVFVTNLGKARAKIDETLEEIIKLLDSPELGLKGGRRRLNYLAAQKHNNHHPGVSPTIAALMHEINLQKIAHGELPLEL